MNGSHLAIGAVAALATTSLLGKRGSSSRDSRWTIIEQGPQSDEAFMESLIEAVPLSGGLAVGRTRDGIVLPVDFSFSAEEVVRLLRRLRQTQGSALLVPMDQKSIEVVRSKKAENEGPVSFKLRLMLTEMPKRTDHAILAERLGAYFVVTKDDTMRTLVDRSHETAPWTRWCERDY